ncbi:MAG: DNA topoisomerase I [Candidatus Micrarchaeia archaeon]|jgi:DNA topoisomerase-1
MAVQQLIICEKPRVAEKVASALAEGNVERKQLNNVAYYLIKRAGKEIAIAPAVGHLYTLKQVKPGSGYPVFDIEWAPSYEVDKGAAFTKAYLKNLETLGKQSKEFINSCDFDTEGSLIGYNVIRFACKSKKGKRMKFSALTPEDLVEAYENASELDTGNIKAGEARHMLDWFYGINLSRALMAAIRTAGTFKVMSIGRVQGPALKILSDRERAIAVFKPMPYWEITAQAAGTTFINTKGRFQKKEEADAALKATSKSGTVSAVEVRQYLQNPNVPFDLTSLQVEAYRWFGFSPSQTLELAQSLYEDTFISYPRTSSQKLPAKLNHTKLLSNLAKNPAYKKLADQLLAAKRITPLEGKSEDPAHPAIHPLSPMLPQGQMEAKLYDLIVKRFLACFAAPAKRESGRLELQLGSEKYEAKGARTVERNWMDYYEPYVKFEEVTLPTLKQGDAVHADKLAIGEKKTKPPSRFTQAGIIEELESRDLGTKATRSVVIDTLAKRGYTRDRTIHVTPFGLAVCSALEHNCPEILDEELTRDIEREMDFIRAGTLEEEKVIEHGKGLITSILIQFKKNEAKIGSELVGSVQATREQESLLGPCEKCGSGQLKIIRLPTGSVFAGCTSYPNCRNTYPLPQHGKLLPLNKACTFCGRPTIRVIRQASRPFEMCIFPGCESKKNWGKPKFIPKSAAKPAIAAKEVPKSAAKPATIAKEAPKSAVKEKTAEKVPAKAAKSTSAKAPKSKPSDVQK